MSVSTRSTPTPCRRPARWACDRFRFSGASSSRSPCRSIFAGVRTATVYVVATATLATFAGGGGLGDIIVNEPTYGTAGVIAASLTITALAFLVDGALALVERIVTPRPLRHRGRR